MEVILLERIEKLGQMGDVVTVKPGLIFCCRRKRPCAQARTTRAISNPGGLGLKLKTSSVARTPKPWPASSANWISP
jgi:hypothetical protein